MKIKCKIKKFRVHRNWTYLQKESKCKLQVTDHTPLNNFHSFIKVINFWYHINDILIISNKLMQFENRKYHNCLVYSCHLKRSRFAYIGCQTNLAPEAEWGHGASQQTRLGLETGPTLWIQCMWTILHGCHMQWVSWKGPACYVQCALVLAINIACSMPQPYMPDWCVRYVQDWSSTCHMQCADSVQDPEAAL